MKLIFTSLIYKKWEKRKSETFWRNWKQFVSLMNEKTLKVSNVQKEVKVSSTRLRPRRLFNFSESLQRPKRQTLKEPRSPGWITCWLRPHANGRGFKEKKIKSQRKFTEAQASLILTKNPMKTARSDKNFSTTGRKTAAEVSLMLSERSFYRDVLKAAEASSASFPQESYLKSVTKR